MARTELPNGIILPAEYSDDWYDDMTSNLSKLDEVIGSDAGKLSAEDVGAAALSNDYEDLDNKPNLNPYDQHVANTDIHVTAADKQKWNDNISQSYVLRYASTSVTPSSTIAYSVLNNTDNIKAGDSVIDASGQVFLIASVDSANETVTVSALLFKLALDNDVMHLSGNETAAGQKTFSEDLTIYNSDINSTPKRLQIKNQLWAMGVSDSSTPVSSVAFLDKNDQQTAGVVASKGTAGQTYLRFLVRTFDNNNNAVTEEIYYYINKSGEVVFRPWHDNTISMGFSGYRWRSVYATNYYYGANNLEFADKFVTADTNQTVSGQKIFNDINTISSTAEIGVSAGNNSFKVLDKNKDTISRLEGGTFSTGAAYCYLLVNNGSNAYNGVSLYQASANLAQLRPYSSTLSMQLGASNRSFTDCYTSKINNINPGALGLPQDRSARLDISSYFINTGYGDSNTYTVPANGWIYLNLNTVNAVTLLSQTSGGLTNYGDYRSRNNDGVLFCLFPVRNGDVFRSQWYTSSSVTVSYAYFIPNFGNV